MAGDISPFYHSIAKQDYKTITTVALKTLILTHKSQLYCPFLDLNPLKTLYGSIQKAWSMINDKRIRESKDQFRCEYFARLASMYSEFLGKRTEFMLTYKHFIDSCYCL
jgi:hypothetical protein